MGRPAKKNGGHQDKANKRPVGRPLAELNTEIFEELCSIQCTQEEIAQVLHVDHKTLTKWCKRTYGKEFSAVYNEYRSGGKASLRRKQWALADVNAAMAIFLGKNYLGQKDQIDAEVRETVTIVDDIPDGDEK